MAKRDIDFLLEIGSLRNIPRAWQQQIAGRVQNVPEHVFRVTLIAWMIALGEDADTGKVIKIALLHDLAESRATDIAFMHRGYIERNEKLAQEHLFQNTALAEEAQMLLKEYEERASLEARVVKDADNLEVDFELKELAKTKDTAVLSMQKYTRPPVRAHKLYTKTAKKMWDDLLKQDPDKWHKELTTKWVKNKKSAR